MNVHDSEKIAGIFSESGYGLTDTVSDADVVVLNTCNIRHKAEHKVYTELGRLKLAKQNNPGLKIAVAGCIAQQQGASLFKRFPHVDFVLGPGNIDKLEEWINGRSKSTPSPPLCFAKRSSGETRGQVTALRDNLDYHTKTLPMKREGGVKAWVSIMYGCDNFCAYCVVPYTRGRERSRSGMDIYDEIKSLAHQGFKEVTLLGQNVNSYGKKLEETADFPDLLKLIHDIEGIERIRFITSHPKDMSEKLIYKMQDLPKLCEHMHLPVQSGSDKILKLMNRKYTYKQYKEKIDMLRQEIPGIALTSDIIVGFPGETEEDFKHTMDALSEMEFDGIYAFKYSKRPDTKALNLPGHVEEKVKSKRLSQVLDLQGTVTYKKNKVLEGQILEILVEGPSDSDQDKLTGRTRTNKIVNFCADSELTGKLIKIKVLDAKQHSLYGEIV